MPKDALCVWRRKNWGELFFNCLNPRNIHFCNRGKHEMANIAFKPPIYSLLPPRQAPPPTIHQESHQTDLLGHLLDTFSDLLPGLGFAICPSSRQVSPQGLLSGPWLANMTQRIRPPLLGAPTQEDNPKAMTRTQIDGTPTW